jgi:lipoprotein-anchoring transpeptidase ErfK/SrfK
MQRICSFALVTSALYGSCSLAPAFAQAADPANGNGGFIQMIFAGVAREPTVPRPYQPEPQYLSYPARSAQQQSAPQASDDDSRLEQTASTTPVEPPSYQTAPAIVAPSPQRARRQQAAVPGFDYTRLIPMPQVGYELLPPVQQPAPASVAWAPASFTPSSSGDMTHPAVDPKFDRQTVEYSSPETPGTVIIDTPHHFLYLVEEQGKAMRYGIGVGKPGFTWKGIKTVTAKKEWPDWVPPVEMLQRRPELPRYMAGGPENPLGARAMYLGSTLYRIHGSNEPWTIGGDVSSGCIRLRNADVIDLYGRVRVGAKVVVM